MWGDFLNKWRAQRVDAYWFYQKRRSNNYIKLNTKKNRKIRKWAKLHPNNDLLETTRSTRHDNYFGFVKSRVAARSGPVWNSRCFLETFVWKGSPKGAFLETLKIENGINIQLFIKIRHGDPLKTVPGSGFEKTFKTMKFRPKMIVRL